MSEADNPTTPRKRSSHRPNGFGPPPSRDKKLLREPESPPDEADAPPSSTDLSAPLKIAELASEADREAEAAAVAELEPLEDPTHASSVTVAWVNRLTSEFEATTATDVREGQIQQIQEQNLRLQEQNRELLEQKAILEVTLEETQAALQLQMTRSQNQETLLVQQAQALAESQTQTSGLYRDLELAQQTAQRQQIMIETLTEQLESSQERIAQLEQEVAAAQARVNEKAHALMQAEMTCRDLKTRLSRQQRYALQFKTALERCLDMPALRRSMVNATLGAAAATPGVDPVGSQDGPGQPAATQAAALSPNAAPSPYVRPGMTSVDLVEVSSHLHSLLHEAASSDLAATATPPLANPDHGNRSEGPEALASQALRAGAAPMSQETATQNPAAHSPLGSGRECDRSLDRSDERSSDDLDHLLALLDTPQLEPEATPQPVTASLPESHSVAITPEDAGADAITADALTAAREETVADAIAEALLPDLAVAEAHPASPVPFPSDRQAQATLWQSFNPRVPPAATAAEAEETPTIAATADAGLATEVTVPTPPSPSERSIQPLRPSPQIPRFVSQWSEAMGRTSPAAEQPQPSPTVAEVSEAQAPTPTTSFTVTCRRQGTVGTVLSAGTMPDFPAETLREQSQPADPAQPAGEAVTPFNAQVRPHQRLELPRPQVAEEAGAFAAVGQAGAPSEVNEDAFQAMTNWPSPLVYPLRPAKKRKSLAAIDLPNFARPHS
ncbi:hypothetical protein [Trichothermofontia sp.]